MSRRQKVQDPLDLWAEQWDREVRERKNPFSRKPTPEERAAYEQRMKEEEERKSREQEEVKRKKSEESWLRSLPYYRIRDLELMDKINEKLALLSADVSTAFSGLTVNWAHVRDPWTTEKTFRGAGRPDLADRLVALYRNNQDRKFIKAMNRDDD